MTALQLDTHVVVWLYEPRLDKLAPVLARLEGRPLAISPIVLLELQYLHEIGRLTVPGAEIVGALEETAGLTIAQTDWSRVVRAALPLRWTRDPFDRLIVAQALADGATLLSADEHLRAHSTTAVWG